jgi:hypothetical protein
MKRVVDTNVPITANGKNDAATAECRLSSLEFLNTVLKNGKVILDIGGEIQDEYNRHLNAHGQPGVGDLFYKTILESSPQRVERIELLKDPNTGDYVEFPQGPELSGFDKSDRKFAVAARVLGIPVTNATDTDWLDYRIELRNIGVEVEFLCGCNAENWFDI